jgi:hypothetical protein
MLTEQVSTGFYFPTAVSAVSAIVFAVSFWLG